MSLSKVRAETYEAYEAHLFVRLYFEKYSFLENWKVAELIKLRNF